MNTNQTNAAKFLDAYRSLSFEPKSCTMDAGTKPSAMFDLRKTTIGELVNLVLDGTYTGATFHRGK